jgi:sporulation-control protein spo0M
MPFIFNNNCIKAFKELKNQFISSLVLCHYDLDLKLMLEMDASDRVIVGILSQLYLDGEWYSITFFLKTIDLAECNYKVYNKEMLAII